MLYNQHYFDTKQSKAYKHASKGCIDLNKVTNHASKATHNKDVIHQKYLYDVFVILP